MKTLWQFRCGSRGSAMFEFLIIMGLILPLGFGAAMLGKLIDLQQNTEMASRYAVWEASVYSRDKLSTLSSAAVDSRLYHDQNHSLSSDDGTSSEAGNEHPLWGSGAVDTSGMRQLANVSKIADMPVVPNYTFDTGSALVAAATGKIVSHAGKPLSAFSGNSWGLVADGLLRSNIEVAVEPTGMLHALNGPCANASKSGSPSGSWTNDTAHSSDTTGNEDAGNHVCIRSSGVILADGWSASDDVHTVSRVRSLVPSSALSSVGQGVGNLLGSTLFPELKPLNKAFGYVDISVLPEYVKP